MTSKDSSDHADHTGDAGDGHSHDDFKEVLVSLELDHIRMLDEVASEYTERLGQDWDLSAVMRVAVGHFLTRLGKMA